MPYSFLGAVASFFAVAFIPLVSVADTSSSSSSSSKDAIKDFVDDLPAAAKRVDKELTRGAKKIGAVFEPKKKDKPANKPAKRSAKKKSE